MMKRVPLIILLMILATSLFAQSFQDFVSKVVSSTQDKQQGEHHIRVNMNGLTTGAYVYMLDTKNNKISRKPVVLK